MYSPSPALLLKGSGVGLEGGEGLEWRAAYNSAFLRGMMGDDGGGRGCGRGEIKRSVEMERGSMPLIIGYQRYAKSCCGVGVLHIVGLEICWPAHGL